MLEEPTSAESSSNTSSTSNASNASKTSRARRRRGRGGQRPTQSRQGPDVASRKERPDQLGPDKRSAARADRRERRAAAVPTDLHYPAELPVVARKDDIAAAIRDHQVVVIAGETGSGKTTQLPKICLELGRGVKGTIGHTQPRRIAARSVAERIADELRVNLGSVVGYQVRFADHSTADTLIKVMTDGILLGELQRDRDLRRYDTLIIDEAHERSLNIDFIIGYLKQLLPRRPDLKVIITSATIDPQRFAEHFADPATGRPAPIVEVSGRMYPVHLRYRPLTRPIPGHPQGREEETDQVTGILEAVEELWTEGSGRDGAGEDILVFLSGEREIRDAAEALARLRLPSTQILPLYARLSAAEQHRVFARHSGRRVVLATNVAETSLTVPGIRYVVDTGTARISRYSQRLKVQRLPIEPISQASARQRSGRCGRLADGVAIRLYSESDHDQRPEYTDPEILRTNLAAVILQMTALGLGEIARFPFVDPPDARQIADGVRLLQELGALDSSTRDARQRLTPIGRRLAQLPVEPRFARMLLASHDLGSLGEVVVIVAALSLQDVRERPAEAQTQADQQHARFKDEHSDFITLLNLWNYLKQQQKELSGSAFRRLCKSEYLHYLRIREWQDLQAQLRHILRGLDLRINTSPATPDQIHQALLAGLLSHVGLRDPDRRDYLGARGARFAIQPGSTLQRRPPDWVMSAELVETTRLWARTNAVTDPAWVEAAATHLVKRSYAEPRWSRSRAGAVAAERVTLYGVPLATDRTVALGQIDPVLARELFIRNALVEGDWNTSHRFFHDNRKLVARLADLEHRARRRDILVDDERLVAFYEERLPPTVISGAHFDSWWKTVRRADPCLLTFTEDLLLSGDAAERPQGGDYTTSSAGWTDRLAEGFPQAWLQAALRLPLSYQFEPGTQADGVTCHIPLDILNQVQDHGFDWQVPGMRIELATALLKSLPKATRKHFVPTPDHAQAALEHADSDAGASLTDELTSALYIRTGVRVPPHEWDWNRVPDHLRITFRIEDGRRRRVAEGKHLTALKEHLAPKIRASMQAAASSIERRGLTSWSFGELPSTFERQVDGRTLHGYPALVDEGDSVAVAVLATPAERDAATRRGVRRLVLLNTTVPWPRILRLLSNAQKLALGNNPHGSVTALLDDALAAAVDARLAAGTIREEQQFDAALAAIRQQLVPAVVEVVEQLHPTLDAALRVRLALERMTSPALAGLRADLVGQLDALVYDGFIATTGLAQLRHLPRYLRGMVHRIEKAPSSPLDMARDAQRQVEVHHVEAERVKLLAALPTSERDASDVVALRWMIEELRVSLFAQPLGTAYPVSAKRIYRAMDAVEDAH